MLEVLLSSLVWEIVWSQTNLEVEWWFIPEEIMTSQMELTMRCYPEGIIFLEDYFQTCVT